MPVSIVFFLYAYLFFLFIWGLFSSVALFHMFKYGFKNQVTFITVFLYIAVSVIILLISFFYISQVNWNKNIIDLKNIDTPASMWE
jgi:hypothetical protein